MSTDGSLHDRHGFTLSDFFLTVLTGLVGLFVVAALAAPIGDGATLLVASIFGQFTGHLVGVWMVVRRRNSSFAALGLQVEPSDGIYILGGMGLQFLIAFAFIPLARLLEVEGSSQALAEEIPRIEGPVLRAGMILGMTLLAPVAEELMFRGLLPKVLGRWMGVRTAFVLAAAAFALFHLLGVNPDNLLQGAAILVPQLFIVGLILGWQVQRRGRLGVAIFLHSGFNVVAVLALSLAPELLS